MDVVMYSGGNKNTNSYGRTASNIQPMFFREFPWNERLEEMTSNFWDYEGYGFDLICIVHQVYIRSCQVTNLWLHLLGIPLIPDKLKLTHVAFK